MEVFSGFVIEILHHLSIKLLILPLLKRVVFIQVKNSEETFEVMLCVSDFQFAPKLNRLGISPHFFQKATLIRVDIKKTGAVDSDDLKI